MLHNTSNLNHEQDNEAKCCHAAKEVQEFMKKLAGGEDG